MIKLKLIHKFKEYEIPCQFKSLPNVKKEIYSQLLFSPTHQYFVKSNVDELVLQSFIDYWVNEKEPNIQFKNYYQYFLLSHEFNLMKDFVESAKEKWDEYEQNLYILNEPSVKDKSIIEQNVSEHLDYYLENHGEKLMNLNMYILSNIFNNKQRKLTKHDFAYELIINYHQKTKNDTYLPFLEQ